MTIQQNVISTNETTWTKKSINEEYKLLTNRITDADYETGSEWIIESADLVKQFFANTMSGSDIPRLLVALIHLDVRDYALGLLEHSNPVHIILLKNLISFAPKSLTAAPNTLIAVAEWESGNTADALVTLSKFPSYPLAKLVGRSIVAGWSCESFSSLRNELNQKVTDKIYGKGI